MYLTFKAEYPCFTRVSAHGLSFCTFKIVLKNECLCKDFVLSCIYGKSATVGHHLNSQETLRAVQRIEDGFSQCQVARTLGVSTSDVNGL